MTNFRIVNIITGWIIFLISAVVYLTTMEPTASFWDCGEFISAAYKLEVGHPPGAPFFMILGRFFTLFAPDKYSVALMINSLSAIASAFTILFLFWSVTHLSRKFFGNGNQLNTFQVLTIIGSGITGALAYTFSDTFWFSAAEGEVYALSSLLTAIVFWAILKWENNADSFHANRWLILIAYLMGLSIGVHLLNLLAIPAIVFVYYFKKHEVTKRNVVIVLGIAALILAVVMYGIIPGIVLMASKFELFTVNTLGLSYNSGLYLYLIVLIASVVYGIYITHLKTPNFKLVSFIFSFILFLTGILVFSNQIIIGAILAIGVYYLVNVFMKGKYALINTIIVSIAVLIIGYSSYAVILIRSNANPPMDQNNPENLFNLLSYLNREQYGDRPLIYGAQYSAPVEKVIDGNPEYVPQDGKYIKTGYKPEYQYDSRFKTLFPRMYSPDPQHIEAYQTWASIRGVKVPGAKSRDGAQLIKPTFGENLKFFFRYQVNHMYLRYFFWNFAGRQNDVQSHFSEEITKGNWLSGIRLIDEARLGPLDDYPDSLKNNEAHNTYFFIPLLLGLAGLLLHYRYARRDFWVVLLLFFFTGLAIVIYLNQTPYQPRERDYAYAGSFYAFSIWIGLGIAGIVKYIKILQDSNLKPIIISVLGIMGVPVLMATQNWDDHDRSGRYTARDFAYNYLMSCEKNGIIFTNGDNDTFPLWYAQEVEGYRTDVRVINLSYLSADWYIEQMEQKAYESEPVRLILTRDKYMQGKRDIVYITNRVNKPVDLRQAIEWVASDDPKTKQLPNYNEKIDYIPANQLFLDFDSIRVINNNIVPEHLSSYIGAPQIKLDRNYITKNHLMALDIIESANWERPVYYAVTVSSDNYLNFDNHFIVKGMTYQIAPVLAGENEFGQRGLIDSEAMYKNLVEDYRWGGITSNDNIYLDENNRRMLSNYRNSFSMLAHTLIREEKTERALNALNRSFEVIPTDKVPYDYFCLPLVEAYYLLGDIESGNQHITQMSQLIEDELDYYLNLPAKHRKNIEFEIRLYMTMLQQSIMMTEKFNQMDIRDGLKERMDKHIQKVRG